MSEVQAPPPGADQLPSRPPSKPSRVPLLIWTVVAVFCLIAFGAALGLYLWSQEAYSSKDLKKATSVRITYTLKGNNVKSVVVDDPDELKKLLDALVITDTTTRTGWMATPGSLDFTLPDGKIAVIRFVGPTLLDRAEWGQLTVEPDFYSKVNEIATRAEKGRRVDVMRVDN